MKTLFLLFFMGFASALGAQTVTVTSGEHETFSRLVLTFQKHPDWALFRNNDGYSLRTEGTATSYDLSDVFRRIPKERLTDIYKDPDTGFLRLGIKCRCHAIPFELRKGIIVIDIKDGAAPSGSSFELGSDGARIAQLGEFRSNLPNQFKDELVAPSLVPANVATDLDAAIKSAARAPVTSLLDSPNSAATLAATKRELLWQLSKGVADGTVEIGGPEPRLDRAQQAVANNANIRIGDNSNVIAHPDERQKGKMTRSGAECISDEALDVASWGGELNVAESFAQASTGLVGEFDRPDKKRVTNAVRYYLSLGFGAETRLLLNGLDIGAEDRKIWEAMAYIVDLESPVFGVFDNMEICNSNAAMWAVLASSKPLQAKQIATSAVLRAFSELPLHLRRHLGPSLAERFLAHGDTETAHTIRSAIIRAPGDAGASVALLEAEIALANGRMGQAKTLMETLTNGTSPTGIRATIALILTKIKEKKVVELELVVAAEALLQEALGGADEKVLRNALSLAYASQDRYKDAFVIASEDSASIVELWNMLADRGENSALLQYAVLNDLSLVPKLDVSVEHKLATRLAELGFSKNAQLWQNRNSPVSHTKNDKMADSTLATMSPTLSSVTDDVGALEGRKSNETEKLLVTQPARAVPEGGAGRIEGNKNEVNVTPADKRQSSSRRPAHESDDLWQAASALISTSNINDAPAQAGLGQLAQARNVISESASARGVLTGLLAAQAILE